MVKFRAIQERVLTRSDISTAKICANSTKASSWLRIADVVETRYSIFNILLWRVRHPKQIWYLSHILMWVLKLILNATEENIKTYTTCCRLVCTLPVQQQLMILVKCVTDDRTLQHQTQRRRWRGPSSWPLSWLRTTVVWARWQWSNAWYPAHLQQI